ncbi:MAG TPA: electron transfer flavoprotein subunit alpha/FixB family protein [Geminicoccus sp.]|uniref:electron transfer flavoprotein subunit alpha/FixB family protein n=1 Tax=Geminicoccus sp. TaxID=2024832 RepID=UPI002C85511D|nr:electron transfer flavoprotein subunit alpha/FixB family protein [Geminicoccus sp.]HWL67627.1 electron transfer flavoprotein subunit alpha/FixB family protein [Geminicoccus sp.]
MSARRRRDPHAERDRATRVGPTGRARRILGDVVPAAPVRPRRDPHALRRAAVPGPAGRMRLDPHGGELLAHMPSSAAPGAEQPIIVARPACLILAVLDLPGGRLEGSDLGLLAAARDLADRLEGAVLALTLHGRPDLSRLGVDRHVALDLPDRWDPAAALAALRVVLADQAPAHVLFAETPLQGADLARRLVAATGLAAAFAVHRLEPDEIRARGAGLDLVGPPPPIMTLHEVLLADRPEPVLREARSVPLTVEPDAGLVEDLGEIPVDLTGAPLAEADLIVSAGDGVTDWPGFHALAGRLNATVGGSRQVCDRGLLPRDRQVGASGTLVAPKAYLAFGISGAPQHLQGIERCQRVVAVNTDLHAKMIERADLAIVADAQAVMPALEALLERRRHG